MAGVKSSLTLLSTGLDEISLKAWLNNEQARLEGLLTTNKWKEEFQGKIIFSKLCSDTLKEDPLRIRQAYVDIALKEKPEVFSDITSIYSSF